MELAWTSHKDYVRYVQFKMKFHQNIQLIETDHETIANILAYHGMWPYRSWHRTFTYDIKVLSKIIGIPHELVLEHFKEAFPPNIKAKLLDIVDIYLATGKARVQNKHKRYILMYVTLQYVNLFSLFQEHLYATCTVCTCSLAQCMPNAPSLWAAFG